MRRLISKVIRARLKPSVVALRIRQPKPVGSEPADPAGEQPTSQDAGNNTPNSLPKG